MALNLEKFKIYIQQMAVELEASTIRANDEQILALLDAQEYLKRAWHSLDGSPVGVAVVNFMKTEPKPGEAYLVKHGKANQEPLLFEVDVLETREAFGRTEYLVTPRRGTGRRFVQAGTLILIAAPVREVCEVVGKVELKQENSGMTLKLKNI